MSIVQSPQSCNKGCHVPLLCNVIQGRNAHGGYTDTKNPKPYNFFQDGRHLDILLFVIKLHLGASFQDKIFF